ncbi:hypothetical protein GCM10027168_44140 [Streptomyces capparidis]
MEAQRNTTLEGLLADAGYSHEAFAVEINRVLGELGLRADCSDRQVRRWISGQSRWPWERYRRALEQVLGRPAHQMGFVPRGAAPPPGPAAYGQQEVDPVQRRAFVSSTLATTLGLDFLPGRGRVGMSDIARLEGAAARLDAHFNGLGGGVVLEVATGCLRGIHHMLDHCSYGPRVEQALYRVASGIALCAGWSAHDCGRYEQAAHLRSQGLQAALLARDRIATLRAWSDLAAQAEHAGRHAEAARINRTALEDRQARAAVPLLAALMHARLADCSAALGQPAAMGRHLAAAERAYDRGERTANATPSWMAFLTPAELSGLAAIAHAAAGQYGRAEALTEQALGLLGPQFARNRAYYTVVLAEYQLAQHHIDQAAATAASIRADAVTSPRITARLEKVTAALTPRTGGPP